MVAPAGPLSFALRITRGRDDPSLVLTAEEARRRAEAEVAALRGDLARVKGG